MHIFGFAIEQYNKYISFENRPTLISEDPIHHIDEE
jgi:hypothetical protein